MEKAFITVYRKYADAIFRHCYFRVFSRERGQELMQETFMRTWKYMADGNEIKNLRAFLYRTANNLIVDESRKKKESSLEQLQEEGFDVESPGSVEYIYLAIEKNQLRELLKGLEPHHRQVVVMRYVDGLPPREIAQVLDETPNVISVRINRAVQKLTLLAKAYAA